LVKQKQKAPKSRRGGLRTGAGRKPLTDGTKCVLSYTCKLSMKQSTWLEQASFDSGLTPSAMLRKLIDDQILEAAPK
jgi:hypothetical protein